MNPLRSVKHYGCVISELALALALQGFPLASLGVAHTLSQQAFQATSDPGVKAAQDDKEEARRDREDEVRDREGEKRDHEQERAERQAELYDEGREALDEGQYEQALKRFAELVQLNGPQTDAALYWKAYAENKRGMRDSALATLADLNKRFPQSRWQKDATALAMEVRQSSGQKPNPDAQNDEELKLLAIQGLMNSNPDRAIPLLEKVLNGSASPREKSQALFVLAQSGSLQAMEILGRVASGQGNPELQRKAIEYLGIFGGAGEGVEGGITGGVEGGISGGVGGGKHTRAEGQKENQLLASIYANSNDPSVKRAVLKSYMLAGDRQSLFNAAKNEKNEELKREAIKQLGLVGGENELEQLYKSDNSLEIRREILQSFFLAGDSQRLVQAAVSEPNPELRRAAIKNLGLVGNADASRALGTIYAKETDRSLKEEVLNAYFLEGNATALVAIARSEKDPGLKKRAVEKLSLMDDKVATDYLMELLQK
jgi:Tetratricopeptide repeat